MLKVTATLPVCRRRRRAAPPKSRRPLPASTTLVTTTEHVAHAVVFVTAVCKATRSTSTAAAVSLLEVVFIEMGGRELNKIAAAAGAAASAQESVEGLLLRCLVWGRGGCRVGWMSGGAIVWGGKDGGMQTHQPAVLHINNASRYVLR